MFILLILAFCVNVCGSDVPLESKLPPVLHDEMAVDFIQKNGICVPEYCYATTDNAQKQPLLIVGASPCIAVFIKARNIPTILALHISAHNDLNAMIEIIDDIFQFKKSDKKHDLDGLLLFTRTSMEYGFSANQRNHYFKEEDHDQRFEAIARKLQTTYAVDKKQYYMPSYPDVSEEESYHYDRNLICTGFDEENKIFKVFGVDLKKTQIFGPAFSRKVIQPFFDAVVQKLCCENKEKINVVELECSEPVEKVGSLCIGDKWDYPFYAITEPNIERIIRKEGAESVASKPGFQEKKTEVAAPIKSAEPIVPISTSVAQREPKTSTEMLTTTTPPSSVTPAQPKPIVTQQKPKPTIQPDRPWYSRWFESAKNRWRSILATVGAVGVVGTIGVIWSKWGRNVFSTQQSVTHPSALTSAVPNKLPAK